MTDYTPEALEALNQKATQGPEEYAAFVNALFDSYRTGQLIHAVPSDPWAGQAELLDECQKAASELDRQTLANIRTLTDAQPSGDVVEAVARGMAPKAFLPFAPEIHGSPVNHRNAQAMWLKNATAAITAYEAVSGVAKMREALDSIRRETVGVVPEILNLQMCIHVAHEVASEALGEKP